MVEDQWASPFARTCWRLERTKVEYHEIFQHVKSKAAG